MAEPNVTGARGYAPALASLLTGLETQGIVIDGTTDGALSISGDDNVTGPINTASATLVDITGLSLSIAPSNTARIFALMVFTCSSSGVGTNATGGFAVQIDGTDGVEMQRFLSGTNDTGIGAALMRSPAKVAGSYTVKGRFRRVAGTKDICIDRAELFVLVLS